MAVDPGPTPGGNWPANLIDILKYALIPFSGMGGWAALRWVYEQWVGKEDRDQKRKRDEASERDKVMASLDTRSANFMDRLERTNKELTSEIEAARAEKKRIEAALENERDIVWALALDQEEDAHNRRHNHIASIARANNYLILLKGAVEGTLSPEALAGISADKPEGEPPRLSDLRSKFRSSTTARS